MQGAPLPIAGLAEELGVSTTPVREVLARLAGEGLVMRTPHGYAALLHDPAQLAELYDLAGVLCVAAVQSRGLDIASFDLSDPLAAARLAPNRALGQACARVQAQLSPLSRAETELFGDTAPGRDGAAATGAGRAVLAKAVRRYYARRAAQSGRILAVALGLLKSSRI